MAVTRIVVTDARMLADHVRRIVQAVRFETHGDQGRLVPKPACVEDRADLADDVGVFEALDAFEHVGFVEAEGFADVAEWRLHERERRLDYVE